MGKGTVVQHVYVEPLGQDDNLGDSVLRAAYIDALRGRDRQLHLQVEGQSPDYLSGLPLRSDDVVYRDRREWLKSLRATARPVSVLNAGEWTMRPRGNFPAAQRVTELRSALRRGGTVIAAGLGVQDPAIAATVSYAPVLLEAGLISWRDAPSRDAAGFGGAAPDWAFSLGTPTEEWAPRGDRPLIAVTLRFDRPWPDDAWMRAVIDLARRTDTRIVTVAQVARDSPRAVHLAEALGGEYLVAASTSHDDLDAHVRAVYARSLAVVSDRAHGLIIGATEGAYPIGSAADPQKISRMLDMAQISAATGSYDALPELSAGLDDAIDGLAPGVEAARTALSELRTQIDSVLTSVI